MNLSYGDLVLIKTLLRIAKYDWIKAHSRMSDLDALDTLAEDAQEMITKIDKIISKDIDLITFN